MAPLVFVIFQSWIGISALINDLSLPDKFPFEAWGLFHIYEVGEGGWVI